MKTTSPPKKDAGIAGIGVRKLFEKTLASLSEAILVVNPATRAIVSCNRAAEEMFGYPAAEVIGRNTEFLHIDRVHYEEFGKELFPALNANGVFHKEFMMRRRDGTIFPTDHTVTEIRDDEGNRVGVVSAVRDITGRKRIEDALRESEERYRSLFENSHAVLLVINPDDGAIVDANPAAVAYYGWTREELKNKKISDINTLTRAQVKAEMELAREEKRTHFVFKHRRAQGEPRDVEVYSGPIKIKGRALLYSIIFDIADRKRMEEALRQSETELQEAQRIAHVGSWRLDNATNHVVWTEELYRMLGLDPSRPPPDYTEHMRLFTPESWDRLSSALALTQEKGIPYELELEMVRPDGGNGWMLAIGEPLRDASGSIVGLRGVAQDITERKLAEKALSLKTAELDNFFNTALDLLCIANTDGYFLRLNPEWEKTLGYTLKDLQGKRFLDFVHPDDLNATLQAVSELAVQKTVLNFINRYRRQDGTYRWIEWHSKSVGNLIYAAARDVTERKMAEEKLAKSEERFRLLSENASDLIYHMRLVPDPCFEYVSPSAERIVGYTPEEHYADPSLGMKIVHPDDRALLQRAVETGMFDQPVELRWIHKDGHVVWTEQVNHPIFGKDGALVGITGAARDITWRKKAEMELQQSEERFRNYFELGQVGMAVTSLDQKWLRVNDRLCAILGYTQEELTRMTWTELTHPDDLEPDLAQFRRLLSGEIERYAMDKRFIRKNGDIVHTHLTVSCHRKPDRSVEYFIASVEDISERKRAEEQLRQAALYTRTLIEVSLDPLVTISADGKITDVNSATEKVIGLPRDKLIGSDFSSYFTEPEKADLGYRRVFEEGYVTDYPLAIRHSSGKVADVLYNASVYRNEQGEVAGVFAAARDITERKEAETKLKDSEHRLSEAIINSPNPAMLHAEDGQVLLISKRWTEITGYSLSDIPTIAKWTEKAYAERASVVENYIEKLYGLTEIRKEGEYHVRTASGDMRIWDFHSAPLPKLPDGRRVVLSMATDVTERKRAEMALAQSELNYRTVANFTNDWETWREPDGRFRYVSPSCERITGYPADRFIADSDFLPSIIHGQDIASYNEHIDASHKLPTNVGVHNAESDRIRFRITRKDGVVRWIEHVCQRVFDENGVWLGTRGSNRDISDMVAAHEQAESATKLKDKFVSLVAHDLRSPFTSMMGLLRIFTERKLLLANDEDKKVLDTVFRSGERMLGMIDQLLKISRLQTGQITPQLRFFNGYTSVAFTINSISNSAAQKGVVITNDVPDDMRLYADQALFDEVLLNLLTNAIKFCSRGDKITVFTPPGLKSAIAVRDTGKGVGEKIIPDIFRHDVKTSTVGTDGELGTGLGLPYSYDIMKAHGGELTVESAPDKGSVFCAMLPYARPVALVVDDEPMALLIVKSHLEKIGVDVVEAENGAKALSSIKDRRPHIIIADIMMPGIDGFGLLDRLKQDISTRGIPIIVMTSMDGEIRDKVLRRGADDFVGKPIIADDFIPRVRRFVG